MSTPTKPEFSYDLVLLDVEAVCKMEYSRGKTTYPAFEALKKQAASLEENPFECLLENLANKYDRDLVKWDKKGDGIVYVVITKTDGTNLYGIHITSGSTIRYMTASVDQTKLEYIHCDNTPASKVSARIRLLMLGVSDDEQYQSHKSHFYKFSE